MYGICRVQKTHATAVSMMQYHNDRRPGAHGNQDIDSERTHLNQEWIPHGEYAAEIQERLDAFYKGKRAVRKDAVRLVEGVITASPEFFAQATPEETQRFFADALEFCGAEFGAQNLIHYTIHNDERTPHAHFGFVPIDEEGRLRWKSFFNGREAMSAFQDRFYESVARHYGLKRGSKEQLREHVDTPTLKRQTAAEVAALEEEANALREEIAALEREKEEKERVLDVLNGRFDELRASLRSFVNDCLLPPFDKIHAYIREHGFAAFANDLDGKEREAFDEARDIAQAAKAAKNAPRAEHSR